MRMGARAATRGRPEGDLLGGQRQQWQEDAHFVVSQLVLVTGQRGHALEHWQPTGLWGSHEANSKVAGGTACSTAGRTAPVRVYAKHSEAQHALHSLGVTLGSTWTYGIILASH